MTRGLLNLLTALSLPLCVAIIATFVTTYRRDCEREWSLGRRFGPETR